MKVWVALFVLLMAVETALAGSNGVSVASVAEHAVRESRLTLDGSVPFHLKAVISETTNPKSDYKAEIEEYWVNPSKWTRTIQSPDFSQTIIVNGDKSFEEDKGDYYPWWLRNFVTAIFDPLPMLPALQKTNAMLAPLGYGEQSQSCTRFESKTGTPPAEISEFSVFCFGGDHGVLRSAVTPGYDAIFNDYQGFHGKQVARRIEDEPEPGTRIEARITKLEKYEKVDEARFVIAGPAPSAPQLKSVPVSESTLLGMAVSAPAIVWPPIRGGKPSGVLSMYVSVDRNGHVRETWPLNSDNPSLDDAVRQQVMHWQFKRASAHGVPVQVEGVLTFAFGAKK